MTPPIPTCIHDDQREGHREFHDAGGSTTSVRCCACRALLFDGHRAGNELEGTAVIHDATYAALYTSAGRQRLLTYALTSWGWQVPLAWNETLATGASIEATTNG